MRNRIRRWVYKFLELDQGIQFDIVACWKELRRISRNIEELVDKSIIGADLGYRDESQIIIIQYSRLTNGFKVIADNRSHFPTYLRFVDQMRRFVGQFNAETVVIDAHSGVSKADLLARILPDKKLTDMYKEQL